MRQLPTECKRHISVVSLGILFDSNHNGNNITTRNDQKHHFHSVSGGDFRFKLLTPPGTLPLLEFLSHSGPPGSGFSGLLDAGSDAVRLLA